MKKTLSLLLLAVSFITACKKNGSSTIPKNVPPVLSIISLSVNTGPFSTNVTITGTGFSTTTTNDQVFFNGKAATISAASSTQITAAVPLGAGTGVVTVSVNKGTPITGPIFTYQLSAIVTTFAGNGSTGHQNGIGKAASFFNPVGLTVDISGNVYVADNVNNLIREISPAGAVSTLAGSGFQGHLNGIGTLATFLYPTGVAVDANGNVYVADNGNNLIRKISSDGVVSTFAGSGVQVDHNGTGTAASFNGPRGIAVDVNGNVYVADNGNLIRKISPTGVVTTFAGSGVQGNTNGTGTAASFNTLMGIAVDVNGNVYVADYGNILIRKISPAGVVSTLAGSGSVGNTNGTGTAASFFMPYGITVDGSGNVYVADSGANLIREISPAGVVTTLAGNGESGKADGSGMIDSFDSPVGITVDVNGNVYVADNGTLIRKIVVQ